MAHPSASPSDRAVLDAEPMPRCCPSHEDWPVLVQHLVDDFPEVQLTDIVREVRAAREATQTAGLTDADAW